MTTIRVNRWRIKHNNALGHLQASRVPGEIKPPILVEYGDGWMLHAHEIKIEGKSTMIYRPDDPLPCGASCWIETDAPVIPVGKSENITKKMLAEECNL